MKHLSMADVIVFRELLREKILQIDAVVKDMKYKQENGIQPVDMTKYNRFVTYLDQYNKLSTNVEKEIADMITPNDMEE